MSDTTRDVKKNELVMEHFVSLTYVDELAPNMARFADKLMGGKILGQSVPPPLASRSDDQLSLL